jgi:hypothetical protein
MKSKGFQGDKMDGLTETAKEVWGKLGLSERDISSIAAAGTGRGVSVAAARSLERDRQIGDAITRQLAPAVEKFHAASADALPPVATEIAHRLGVPKKFLGVRLPDGSPALAAKRASFGLVGPQVAREAFDGMRPELENSDGDASQMVAEAQRALAKYASAAAAPDAWQTLASAAAYLMAALDRSAPVYVDRVDDRGEWK